MNESIDIRLLRHVKMQANNMKDICLLVQLRRSRS